MAEIWHSHLSHPVDAVLKRIFTTCNILIHVITKMFAELVNIQKKP